METKDEEMYGFILTFSKEWLLSNRGSSVLPPENILNHIKKAYKVYAPKSKINECSGAILGPKDYLDKFTDTIYQIIEEVYGITEDSNIFRLETRDLGLYEKDNPETDEDSKKEDNPEAESAEQLKSETDSDTQPEEPRKSALEKIHELVGNSDFKKLADECYKISNVIKNSDTLDAFLGQTYIVSINDGYGLSTYLKLFSDLLEELQLFKFSERSRIVETVLETEKSRYSDDLFDNITSRCFSSKNTNKLVCIDISEWMSKLRDQKFRDFLKIVFAHTGENIVFFRIPFVEKHIVKEIQECLNDLLFVRTLSIPPFSGEELKKCTELILQKKNFTLDEDAWDIVEARIAAEKSDGRFYGIDTLNKIIREMLYNKMLYNADHEIDNNLIKRKEIVCMADADRVDRRDGFEQLSELVGMDKVAERVKEIVAQIEASSKNPAVETPCFHMRFVGNPGTGKTTVARILGKILKERGILRNGNFLEHSGLDLCGKFIGETAPKTAGICRDAYGSVLFIDEAYALYRDEGFGADRYGREALDTLVAEMENHRTDFIVIMAGYPDDMEKLMNGNSGLKSRMPFTLEFPNYTREELADIFMSMVKNKFEYDESFEDAVKTYFNSLSDEKLEAKDFSNARFVRNLYERTWGKAALRIELSEEESTKLTVEDFALATADKEFNNILQQKKQKIGFT